MNGGNDQSKEVAFRAFSLLEDYSALTEPWSSDRQQSILVSNRAQAYAMVSDPGVKNCAHCAGVKLYCQYRGFGCSKVDFFGGGTTNAYYQRLLDVVMQELRFPCQGGHGCLVISDSPRLSSAIRLGGSQSV